VQIRHLSFTHSFLAFIFTLFHQPLIIKKGRDRVRGAKRREARLQPLPPPAFSRAEISFRLWSWRARILHTWEEYTQARLPTWVAEICIRIFWRAHSMAASKLCGYSYHCRWRMKLQLFLRRSNVITNKHSGPLRRALFTLPLDYLCGRRCHRHYLSGSVLTAVRRRSRCWPKLKIQLRLRPASVPRIAIVHSDPRL